MGTTFAEITLVNTGDELNAGSGILPKEEIREMKVQALVDSGADMLTINESVKNQLGLRVRRTADVMLADGVSSPREIVGPVTVKFKTRSTTCDAVVLPTGDEVLLGAIPLEGLDVIIDLQKRELTLPPERPYLPRVYVR